MLEIAMKKARKKAVPHEFILEALESASPHTKLMFGTTGIYVGDMIVAALRDRENHPQDNGMWLATTPGHHASLQEIFPSMRSISLFGEGVSGWQVLPASAVDFESAALEACELILSGDRRIGKIPQPKPVKKSKKKTKNKATRK